MITLLGSLIGFTSAALPNLLQLWQENANHKHELAMLDVQIKQQQQIHQNKLQKINTKADIAEIKSLHKHDSLPSGYTWIEGLRSSVRPVITYAFFLLFATVKLASLFAMLDNGNSLNESLLHIWDNETQALFAAVVSFWFGQRALVKFSNTRD